MGIATDEVLERLKYLARTFGRDGIQYVIVVILLELGIPTHYFGFDYLVKAIIIYFQDPEQMIVDGLYPAVAKMCPKRGVWGVNVENSIRNAIKAAWIPKNNDAWRRYFGLNVDEETEKPSNTAFISGVAILLKLWEGCCKEYEKQKRGEEVLV